jgi:hypothetical protein
MIYQGKARHPVREVVLHCAAINTGQFDGMPPFQVFATIDKWHRQRQPPFKCFGYHGLIMPSGLFYRGRPFDQIGAHVIGHNAGTLGFLLIESRKITQVGQFSDWFTPAQDKVLRAMLEDLRISQAIQTVSGHNDYANKLCPGFRVSEWLNA